jgi:hypothetical protein
MHDFTPTDINLLSHFVLYLLESLLNLGIRTHKVHQLATKLHCHSIKSLNKVTKTRHRIHFSNNSVGMLESLTRIHCLAYCSLI